MTTQYTSILKLALPVTGELSGTWGDVVNNNITSMVEQAIAGLSTINTWTANAHTLTVADGTTSESRCAMLVADTGAGGTALTAAGEIICPAASKLYVLKNGAAYAVTLKTAAGTGVAVPAGDTAFLFCDGTNVNACVTTVVNGHISGNLTVDGNTTLGDANTDTVTVTAQFASDLLPSTDNARDLGSTAKSWRTLYCDTSVLVGNLSLAGNTLSSTDTNGNIVIAPNGTGDVQLDADTVRVGDSNANATITTNGTGDLILNTNAGTNSGSITIEDGVNGNIIIAPNGTGQVQITNAALDLTTIEVSNINANDGTAAITIANATGAVNMLTAVTMSATADAINLGTSQTTGTFTIGGTAQTGTIALGRSTKTQSVSIATGSVESGETKTINIGTTGDSGSTTTINIGSGSGTITTNFSGTVNAVTTNVVGSLTASNAVTFSATTQNIALGTSQSSGTWTAGGASQTGALTLDQSTKTHTLNLGTGATESGETKTINLGTGGVSTSTTAINIGSANGTTLTINSSAVSTPNGLNFDSNTFVIDATNNRVGINNASPTVALDVTGALTISGNAILGDASTDTVLVNGYMGVGGAASASRAIYVQSTALTGTTQSGIFSSVTGSSAATSNIDAFRGTPASAAAAFTVANMSGLRITDGTKGAGSTITSLRGILIDDQTQGTNNYGIESQVSSGANKWNIYASGTANNAFAGNVRIGSTTAPTNALDVTGAMTVSGNTTLGDASTDTVTVNGYMGVGGAGASNKGIYQRNTALTGTAQYGITAEGTFSSAGTSAGVGFASSFATEAASYTVTEVSGFKAFNVTKGAGSTITNQHGVYIADQTQGTNNYGITSLVSSGTNKWNIYASGTAANYFAGNVLVGTTASLGTAGVQAAAVSTDPFEGYRFGANANGPTVSLYKNRGATVGTNAVVVSGDELGTIAFRGYDGAAYRAGAFITGNVDGTPGASDMPGRLTFSTTADGAATPTERMRIDASGNVRVGTAALATTATNGFLYIPTCAGTPTGTPTAITGLAPMVIDSTNNKLYIYSGGAWVALN